MGKRSRNLREKLKTLNFQKTSKLKVFLIVFPLLFLLVLGLLSLSYSNYSPRFLSKDQTTALDAFVGSIPFLPKTPKQVLALGLTKNQDLNSYSMDVEVLVKVPQGPEIINLRSSGAIANINTPQSASEIAFTGNLFSPLGAEIDLRVVEIGNDLYFLLTKAPLLPGLSFQGFTGNWRKVNLEDFQLALGVKAKTDGEITQDVHRVFEKLYYDLVGESFSRVKDFREIEESGKEFYQVTLTPNVNNVDKALGIGAEIETREAQLEILIDKKTYHLSGVDLETKVLPTEKGLNEQLVNVLISVRLSRINENIKIEVPSQFVNINSPTALALVLGSEAKGQYLRIGDIGENFLTLERLIRVLLLLPKSL